MKLGIPAVIMGTVEDSGDAHAHTEWIIPSFQGVQKLLLTVLGLAGVEGVASPINCKE